MEVNNGTNSFEDQIKFLTKLNELIDSRAALISSKPKDYYKTQEINELATAFAKSQGEYPVIKYNRETSMFQNEYTDLDLIMRTIRPILSKNGLAFVQYTKLDEDGATVLHSVLMHSSGQWMESRARIIPSKNDKLVVISEINTIRRIQAMALLNITVQDDLLDDNADEANKDFEDKQQKGTELNYAYNPKKKAILISKDELKDVQYELQNWPDIAEHLLDRLKIETFADMPKDQYRNVMNYIHSTVKIRSESKKT